LAENFAGINFESKAVLNQTNFKTMFTKIKKTIAFILIAGIGGYAGSYVFNQSQQQNIGSVSSKNRIEQTIQPTKGKFVNMSANEVLPDFVKAADASVHAVVHVKIYGTPSYNPFADPWGFFGQQQRSGEQRLFGTGSGVIVTSDGYIVTNNHVVNAEGAPVDKVEVTLNNHRSYTAKVVGTDPATDLALLKIEEQNLPFIAYGNSDDLKVGEWVLAVGNPFQLTSTVTAGIVSAKARNIGMLGATRNNIESYIQTDAAVNQGNSGGALVNTRGELVGINAAIASPTGAYSGYAFAIPVNIVRKVMDDLAEFGTVQRGFIGISIREVDSKIAQEKGLKDIKGVYVAGLTEGGAAKQAGIREGDVILKVGNADVNSTPELQEQVSRFRPGDKVGVTVNRDGKEMLYHVTLRNFEGSTAVSRVNPSLMMLGGTFEEVSKNEKSNLGISGGVKISKLGSGKLRSAGIREGFIITSINHKPVRSTDDVEAALRDKQGGVLIEGIYPNGMKSYYGFGM
jgi:serine protease Do